MVLNNSLTNITNLIPNPLDIVSNSVSTTLSPLMGLFKAIGIAVLVYIIFLIIRAFLSIRTTLRIKQIALDVKDIKDKVNILIKSNQKNKK